MVVFRNFASTRSSFTVPLVPSMTAANVVVIRAGLPPRSRVKFGVSVVPFAEI